MRILLFAGFIALSAAAACSPTTTGTVGGTAAGAATGAVVGGPVGAVVGGGVGAAAGTTAGAVASRSDRLPAGYCYARDSMGNVRYNRAGQAVAVRC